MDLTYIAVLGGVCAVFSAIFSFFWRWLFNERHDRRVTDLENDVDSLEHALLGVKSQRVQAENKELEAEFMAQAQAVLAGEGEMKEKLMKVVAMNPAMAMKLAKKMGLGKLF